ncbi:sugar 3,4-ketoisomerase [Labilibacter marinus]|uniref:sugar 3,4-ketoisomerase n=1 Tax=Labilibacter marinus TaxID=1477105 RepID=UPI000837A5E6|nr:FdtA/QdtA family cupin domain-containing protein [Labilibacter marinus]
MCYNEVSKIELPKIKDLRGNLSFLEEHKHIPFKINRVYWIYDVPGGEERGGHAFVNTNEFIIPLSGGFKVEVIEGEKNSNFQLDTTNHGLFIPKMTWRKITGFLSNSVCLVVTDTKHKDSEYVRDYMEYIKLLKKE